MKTVPLATYPNEFEAHLAVQRLENEGIPAFVKALGGGYGIGVSQFISHRVYVQEQHLSRAEAIVEGREIE